MLANTGMPKQTMEHLRSSQTRVVAAVDLGASSGRLMLGWLEAGLLKTEEIYRFENKMRFDGEHYIWDLDVIFEHIKAGLRLQSETNIVSIGVDTWGVDYVLLDNQGQILDKAYAYRDHRTDKVFSRVLKEWDNQELYRLTGLQFMTFNTLYQLKAHMEQNPQVFRTDTNFLMLPDYFHYKLCGLMTNEFSNLSTTQLLDVEDRELNKEILSYINVDAGIFPQMYMPGDKLGPVTQDICKQTGLSPQTKVILPCTHDTGSAVLASVGASDSVYICSGTWSLMGIVTDKPIVSDKAYKYSFSNEGGVHKSTRLLKNIMGMWIINQVTKELAAEKNNDEVAGAAAKEEPFVTLINPNDSVFFNPESMVRAIQNYAERTSQKIPRTLGEIARCVYDSLALLYNTVLIDLEDIMQQSFASINIIGGGSKNSLLNQITADITQKVVHAGPVETSALGSIVLQMISLEIIEDLSSAKEIIGKSEQVSCYTPQHLGSLGTHLAKFDKICNLDMGGKDE